MKEYDENEVIKLIRAALPENSAKAYSDDDLLNIVDMIWDYYEMNGLLDVDCADDDTEELDLVSELIDYAKRMLKKDKGCKVSTNDLGAIIEAELSYEDMLDSEM